LGRWIAHGRAPDLLREVLKNMLTQNTTNSYSKGRPTSSGHTRVILQSWLKPFCTFLKFYLAYRPTSELKVLRMLILVTDSLERIDARGI